MVATVGSISIDLSTNLAKFSTGFKSAATTVDQQSARMSKSVSRIEKALSLTGVAIRSFIGGVVGGAGFQALTSFTGAINKARESLSEFEEIGNRARTTGLSTQTFQALSFGAAQADVEQEKLNKSLEIFAKNVGLAREGTGGLYNGLLKLNPELLKSLLTTEDQEERLKLVSNALAQTTDATQKAALANAVFGKSGIELVRLLDGGAQSIDRLKQTAQDLGIIVPDDLIQRAGELDDKLSLLATVVDVNLSQALVNIAPLLVKGAEGAASFAAKVNELAQEITKFAENPSLANFNNLLDIQIIEGSPADKVRDFVSQVVDHLADGREAWKEMEAASVRSAQSIEKEIAAVEAQLAALQSEEHTFVIDAEITKAERALTRLEAELNNLPEVAKAASKDISTALAQAFRAAEIASMDALNGIPKQLPTVYGGLYGNKVFNPTGAVHRNVKTPTGSNIGVHSFGNEDSNKVIQKIDEEIEANEEGFEESVNATEQSGEKINRGLDRLGSGIGDNFDGLIDSVSTGTEELRRLREEGKTWFNYASLEAAIRTGIVTGMDDSLLGKQFKIATQDPLNPFGIERQSEADKLEAELERLKIQASAAGSLAADAFAVRVSQLELKLFDVRAAEDKAASDLELRKRIFGGASYAGAFADGGSFKVGGNQTGDSNLVFLRANEGETVSVSDGGQRPIILNYHAAPGESERTSRQNARAMLEVAQRETGRL